MNFFPYFARMGDKASITPGVLKWARETAKLPLPVAAGKVPVSTDRLQEWENGVSQPTINQAMKLAKVYKRPFAVLFLPVPPNDFLPLQDFRRTNAIPLGTASTFIIRELQQKQSWIGDFLKEENEYPLSFVGKYTITANPVEVAKDILRTLQLRPGDYKAVASMKDWIQKIEAKGIFVSRASFINARLKLNREELQGFAIADKYAPLVFINSDDWSAPQLFTLLHEIAHIWIAESGISNEIAADLSRDGKYHPVELFCNEVAANVLMPEGIMRELGDDVFVAGNSVFLTAKAMGVSSFALLVRAYNLGLISLEKYRRLKQEADREFQLFRQKEEEKRMKQKESEGGPSPYRLLVNKNGQLFTQVVIDAYRNGLIQPTEASRLLNTPTNRFPKLENYIYK